MAQSNLPEIAVGVVVLALTALSIGLADAPPETTPPPGASVAAPVGTAMSEGSSGGNVVTAAGTGAGNVSGNRETAGSGGLSQVYFGNLHSHTSYSDGSGTPVDAFRFAREVAGLDFLAITEHNHSEAERGADERRDGILIANNHALYDGPEPASLMSAAAAWTAPGEFVALYGQEFSTISAGNHVNVFDVPTVIEVQNGDFRSLLETYFPAHPDTTGAPQLVQLNHPYAASEDPDKARQEYGADDFDSAQAWVSALDRHAHLIEVFNGPGTNEGTGLVPARFHSAYLRYLELGFHLAPTGNQDNHYRTWGAQTEARTGVVAEELTKAALLGALKARHAYATLDKNLRFVAHALVGDQRSLLGDIVPQPAPGTAFVIEYELADEDEPDAPYRIEVMMDVVGDGETAAKLFDVKRTGNTPGVTRIEGLTYDGGTQLFLLKVTQDAEHGSDDVLWTAPVWFEEGAPPTPEPAAPDSSKFVASRNSSVFHLSADCRFAKQIRPQNRISGAAAAEGRTPHDGCPLP